MHRGQTPQSTRELFRCRLGSVLRVGSEGEHRQRLLRDLVSGSHCTPQSSNLSLHHMAQGRSLLGRRPVFPAEAGPGLLFSQTGVPVRPRAPSEPPFTHTDAPGMSAGLTHRAHLAHHCGRCGREALKTGTFGGQWQVLTAAPEKKDSKPLRDGVQGLKEGGSG